MTKNPAKSQRVVLGILLAIGLIIFLIGLLQGFVQLVNIHLPTIKARVTNNRVVSVSDGDSPTSYQPEIEFRYTVRGKEYVSKTLATTNSTSYPVAKRASDSYSPGSEHVIHYNPANPGEIYSNAGYTLDFFSLPLALLGVGAVFIAVSLWFGIPRKAAKQFDQKFVQKLFGWVFALLGVGLLLIAVWTAYATSRREKTWRAVDAQVTASRVHRYFRQGDGRHRGSLYFEMIAEFRYSAVGREYVSPASLDFTSSKEANQARALYAPGSRHEIRYNPGDPNDILFYVDSSWLASYIFFGVAVVFVLFGGTCLLMSRRKPAKKLRATETRVRKTPRPAA